MLLTYKPAGSDEPQTWEIDLGEFGDVEAEMIEKRCGLAYGTEFKEALLKGRISARRALLWTLLRRQHHTLRYEDVRFADKELVLEMDQDEWADVRQVVEKDRAIDEDTRAERLAVIDQASADAPLAPGKASGVSSESDTPSLSPS